MHENATGALLTTYASAPLTGGYAEQVSSVSGMCMAMTHPGRTPHKLAKNVPN